MENSMYPPARDNWTCPVTCICLCATYRQQFVASSDGITLYLSVQNKKYKISEKNTHIE